MSSLQDFTFSIAPLWEKEWANAIEQAEGADKRLLVLQARLANLLKNIEDCSITPERLAWVSFWSKAFLALDDARNWRIGSKNSKKRQK
jgi:hypothetical protein